MGDVFCSWRYGYIRRVNSILVGVLVYNNITVLIVSNNLSLHNAKNAN